MSSNYRSGSGGDRPTLPPIRDLFGEELSQSPGRRHGSTNSSSHSHSRSGVGDNDNTQPGRDERRYAGRPGGAAPQRSFPGGNPASHSLSMRPSSNLPSFAYPEANRHPSQPPPSFSHPGHRSSRPSNDPQFRGGAPSNMAHNYPSGHSTPSNAPGFMPPGPPTSYPGGGNFYDSRSGRYSESQHPSARDYPARIHPSIAAGTSTMSHSMQEAPTASSSSSSIAKYECDYCGKGFSRPSSLKIHLNSHTGEKPFTCSFEGCGRNFSVLSNMRRHARTHSSMSQDAPEDSSDEENDEPSPRLTTSSIPPAAATSSQGHRDTSSSGSRSHNRPVS